MASAFAVAVSLRKCSAAGPAAAAAHFRGRPTMFGGGPKSDLGRV